MKGVDRKLKTFRKHSAFITQEDHLLSNLAVDEYMMAAATIELDYQVISENKKSKVTLPRFFFTNS